MRLPLLALALACAAADKSAPDSSTPAQNNLDPTLLDAACIQANLEPEPQLTRGTGFAGSDWNDPHVLAEGDGYTMFASSDERFDGNVRLFRLVSTDAATWTLSPEDPVMEAGEGDDDWDRGAVETPSVVMFQGRYHLFYTGYPTTYEDVTSFAIGHAISDDGQTWTRDAEPLVQPTDPTGEVNLDFDQFVVGEPGAVVVGDALYLYFTAVGANLDVGTTLQVIGLTRSTDGETWTAPEAVLLPDQEVFPRTDWVGYSTPAAVVIGGTVHLFFDVVQDNPWQQVQIRHAWSEDGSTGWTMDDEPLVSVEDLPWATREVRAPSAVLDGETLRLWFAGDDGATLGIGASSCDLVD